MTSTRFAPPARPCWSHRAAPMRDLMCGLALSRTAGLKVAAEYLGSWREC